MFPLTGKDVNPAVVLSKMYTKEHQPQIFRLLAQPTIYFDRLETLCFFRLFTREGGRHVVQGLR